MEMVPVPVHRMMVALSVHTQMALVFVHMMVATEMNYMDALLLHHTLMGEAQAVAPVQIHRWKQIVPMQMEVSFDMIHSNQHRSHEML
jgi:hypothetical protein